MRIRTVKPEFWTHPVLARKSDTVKLLAVGLLNYADDEGYFLADPLLVRGALRAFDDNSSRTRDALDELSQIGYVEVSTHATHGDIGRVVSFLTHQRIDRPNPSKLAHLFDSTSVRRALVANASTEQGREQGTGKGKEQGMDIPARQLAESVYEAYPRKVGRPVALRAIARALTTTDHETLLKATVAYAEARRGQDQQFTPMPATWFNQQRYLDEPSTWTNSPAIKPKERNERTEHLTLTIDR